MIVFKYSDTENQNYRVLSSTTYSHIMSTPLLQMLTNKAIMTEHDVSNDFRWPNWPTNYTTLHNIHLFPHLISPSHDYSTFTSHTTQNTSNACNNFSEG
jgi:hypothetical protein